MGKFFQYSSAAYLLIIMLIKMMGMQIAVLDYALNRDFIATNLCENRFAPETRCEGRCFLKKQLAKTSETPESSGHKSASKVVDVDFFEQTRDLPVSVGGSRLQGFNRSSAENIPEIFLAAVFHPPLV